MLGTAVLEEDQLRSKADVILTARCRVGYLHKMNTPRGKKKDCVNIPNCIKKHKAKPQF
jgi:hypothetical protein